MLAYAPPGNQFLLCVASAVIKICSILLLFYSFILLQPNLYVGMFYCTHLFEPPLSLLPHAPALRLQSKLS